MNSGFSEYYLYGYSNSTQILEQLILVNTYDEFSNAVKENWKNQSTKYNIGITNYSPYTTLSGGFWMGSDTSTPTVMVNIRQPDAVNRMMNFYTVMASGVGISSSYDGFATTQIPELMDFKAVIFIVYYGLIMAWYVISYQSNGQSSDKSIQLPCLLRSIPNKRAHIERSIHAVLKWHPPAPSMAVSFVI